MLRYRLRFLLQEMEITGAELVIGRSPTCHITLEDPLVSRKHAIIRILDDRVIVIDLGSRNGVRVNGRAIHGEHALSDGDRIRIGTQDLVFLVANQPTIIPRPTGFMRLCEACRTPYPDGVATCPHCGAPTSQEDDTVSGVVEPRRAWTLDLLSEVIERALASGKVQELEKLLRRAADEVEVRLRSHEKLDPAHLHQVASYALQLARLQGETPWFLWTVTLYISHAGCPDEHVVDLLVDFCHETEDRSELHRIMDPFLEYLENARTAGGPATVVATRLRHALDAPSQAN